MSRISLLWKIMLSTSVAITLLFAVTGWIALNTATRATTQSVNHEVQASFQAYQSLWKARADRLSSISAILSGMSDVRAAFRTGDAATIRDVAGELWSRVSDEGAFFLVTNPRGNVIASLGGLSRESLPGTLSVVRDAFPHFPAQASGIFERGDNLYHITITPIYVQSTGGTALLNVLVAGYQVDGSVADRLKRSTGGSEFLFVSQGRVVASTLPAPEARALAAQVPRLSAAVRLGSSQYAPLVTTLTDINGAPVGQLAILRSFAAANEQISDLRRNLSLLWLITMAAGLALTYMLARRIIGPVKELDRAALEVSKQNYDYEVAVKSEDELGRLASTFNAMCASIRQAREELIHSERITTIGRLATSVVHDLRNPLAAIYGGAEMLIYSELSPDQTQRLARNMYRASLHIQELLQDLLEVGRGRTGQPAPCDLRQIVDEVGESLGASAELHGAKLVLDVPENLELTVDAHLFKRVFANLIGNAIDAMPQGGTVTVFAKAEPASVLVEVRDTGPGIPPEIRDRLFQPFSTSGKGKGLGLGLALARQIVADHGGEMWLNSQPGQGTCFSFRVPRAGNGASTPGQTEATGNRSRAS